MILALLLLALAQPTPDPDVLYRDRANIASARRAAELWQGRLESNAADFTSAWKFARATYWLGQHDSEATRRTWLERGVAAAQRAAALEPKRPEGHFWAAATMGALAESFGLRAGLRYRGAIRDALETVLRVDAGFMEGSADRALGRWYLRVPALFGGSRTRSEQHLRRSLTYNPQSTISNFFLAETLLAMDRVSEALAALQKVIEAPLHPDFVPEDQIYKRKAAELLAARTMRRN